MSEVRHYRYAGFAKDGRFKAWWIAFIDEAGCLSVQSDFGNWSYRWLSGKNLGEHESMRLFLIGCDTSYVIRKISRLDELDVVATVDNLREYIGGALKGGHIDAEAAEYDREGTESISDMEDLREWVEQSYSQPDMSDDMVVYRYPLQAQQFMKIVWPDIIAALEKDIKENP